jgi:hypothetical protein
MSWKKVVVSGSNAHLNTISLGNIGTPADGAITASGKVFANTREDATLSSYDIVIKGPGGEFMHTASSAINPTLQSLNISTGFIQNGSTYNGSGTQTISIDSGSLAGNGLNATTSGTHTAGFEVKGASNGAITVTSTGVAVATGSLAGAGLSANDGDISSLAVGAMGVNVDGTTITVNGSGQLVASAGTLSNALSNGNGIQTFSFDGGTSGKTVIVDTGSIAGAGLTGTAGENGFTNNKIGIKGSLSGNGSLKFTGGEFVNSTITDDGTSAIQIGTSGYTTTIPGDLVVEGTAKFINATNLSTADDFFLMSSGSTADEAFGILGQTGTSTGTGWMYNPNIDGKKRFTMTKDANTTSGGEAGTLVGSAALVVASTDPASTDATYEDADGNMLIDGSGNIYLYF